MKSLRLSLLLIAACTLLFSSAPLTTHGTSALVSQEEKIPAAARQELAAARQATAKYHDIEQALADGYVQITPCIPGEGFHYAKLPLDCQFDPADPEILHYVQRPNGDYKLIAVEYMIPKAACGLPTTPPEGFSGDADDGEWFSEMRGTVWALNAWVWYGNPEGIFSESNPKVTCQ